MDIKWKKSKELIEYDKAIAQMENIVDGVVQDTHAQTIWFLEHKDVYTAGSSSNKKSLLDPKEIPVFSTGRGGDYTYHGPGQRVIYFILDLKKIFAPEAPDLRQYIKFLEQIIIDSLEVFGIKGERREGRIGIWVNTKLGEKKIAAIGVRVRKWVAYHGVAVNNNPNLKNFNGIIPCGISEYGVTSLKELGKDIEMDYFDEIIKDKIRKNLSI